MTATPIAGSLPRTIVNPVIQDRVTFIETSKETGGAYTSVSVRLMPGGGTPLHFHKILTETFTVSAGVLGLQAGKEARYLQAEDTFTVRPGTIHRFFNPGNEPVVFQTLITPGCEGFERSLRILYGLATDGLTNKKAMPRSLTHLAIIAHISDMHSPGLLSMLAPLMRRLTRKAQQSGEMEALISRYCSEAIPE